MQKANSMKTDLKMDIEKGQTLNERLDMKNLAAQLKPFVRKIPKRVENYQTVLFSEANNYSREQLEQRRIKLEWIKRKRRHIKNILKNKLQKPEKLCNLLVKIKEERRRAKIKESRISLSGRQKRWDSMQSLEKVSKILEDEIKCWTCGIPLNQEEIKITNNVLADPDKRNFILDGALDYMETMSGVSVFSTTSSQSFISTSSALQDPAHFCATCLYKYIYIYIYI